MVETAAQRPEITIADKLSALRQLATYASLLPIATALPNDPDTLLGEFGAGYAAEALIVLADPLSGPYAKAACGTILDIFLPEWRELATEEALSSTVFDRNDPVVRRWRADVLERDGHACTGCGADENLHVHHIVRWVDAPHLRAVVSNGRTLCQPCHVRAHAH